MNYREAQHKMFTPSIFYDASRLEVNTYCYVTVFRKVFAQNKFEHLYVVLNAVFALRKISRTYNGKFMSLCHVSRLYIRDFHSVTYS